MYSNKQTKTEDISRETGLNYILSYAKTDIYQKKFVSTLSPRTRWKHSPRYLIINTLNNKKPFASVHDNINSIADTMRDTLP